jgi:ribonuclease J
MSDIDKFRARIHRGTKQIGGTCVELESRGSRILLDLGMPLDSDEFSPALMPNLSGLQTPDASLLALVLSHGHADHWGLAPYAPAGLKVAMGSATKRILHAAAPFVPKPFAPDDTVDLVDRTPIEIGPFRVTPYLVDHSAYDAYALEVEAGGRKLFYSGDIRAHGRKGALFERLLQNPPSDIDALLLEGSSLGRIDPNARFQTEEEIEQRFIENFRTKGFVLVSASAQNIDRIVSLYRACKRTGRTLVLDLYAMEILRATGNPNIPQTGWNNLSVYVPEYQRRHVVRNELFALLEPYKEDRIYRERLADLGDNAVMLFRPAMTRDIDLAELWPKARLIWSQWDGYLKEGPGMKLKADLAAKGVSLDVIHTSGHASILDLKRLAEAIAPKALVPIHTFEGDRFPEFFANVVRRDDGEWWEV